jgi:hypothetical protein
MDLLFLNVHKHFGDCSATEANVSQGQVGEKEVHGIVKV